MEEAKMELMRTAKCPDNQVDYIQLNRSFWNHINIYIVQGVPVLILANKQDLPGAREPKQLEKLLGLHELSPIITISSSTSTSTNPSQAQTFKGWYIQPACAITGEGLQEGLEALYDMIIKKRKINKANKKKR